MALQRRFDILGARRMLRLPFAAGDGLWQDVQTEDVYGGDELAFVGLPLPVVSGDCQPIAWHLRKLCS